jgi:hypothetical protein
MILPPSPAKQGNPSELHGYVSLALSLCPISAVIKLIFMGLSMFRAGLDRVPFSGRGKEHRQRFFRRIRKTS